MKNIEKLKELKSLKELCTPLMEYMRSHYDPYTEICISGDGIKVKQTIAGIPNEERRKHGKSCDFEK